MDELLLLLVGFGFILLFFSVAFSAYIGNCRIKFNQDVAKFNQYFLNMRLLSIENTSVYEMIDNARLFTGSDYVEFDIKDVLESGCVQITKETFNKESKVVYKKDGTYRQHFCNEVDKLCNKCKVYCFDGNRLSYSFRTYISENNPNAKVGSITNLCFQYIDWLNNPKKNVVQEKPIAEKQSELVIEQPRYNVISHHEIVANYNKHIRKIKDNGGIGLYPVYPKLLRLDLLVTLRSTPCLSQQKVEKILADGAKSDFTGCYILFNTTTEKYYVGQSKNVYKRLYQHISGKSKGGGKQFDDDVAAGHMFLTKVISLKASNYDSLDALEADLIAAYDAYNNGYNKTRGNSK